MVDVYNKMHVGYKVTMEWGIGGMKWKWKWLMKQFDFTKSKYGHLFHATVILIIFLHKHWIDFIHEVLGNQIEDPDDYG